MGEIGEACASCVLCTDPIKDPLNEQVGTCSACKQLRYVCGPCWAAWGGLSTLTLAMKAHLRHDCPSMKSRLPRKHAYRTGLKES